LHKRVDQNLKSKLTGIENEFINYLFDWYKICLEEGIEDLSEDIEDSIKEYRKDVDSVKTFIEEALVKPDNDKDKILTTSLLNYHNLWSVAKLKKNTFAKRMTANEIIIVKSRTENGQGMAISGYKFNTDFIESMENRSE
jgi:phage/plasmid-associated DNA primase